MRFISFRRWQKWITTPYVVFPALGILILWAVVLNLISVERAAAERAAALLTSELVDTYEAQVIRSLREIDQTLKFVTYAYELGEKKRDLLGDLKERGMLPPDLLFTVSIANREGSIVASTRPAEAASVATQRYFRAHREQQLDHLWMDQAPLGATGEGTLHFSRRLNTADGTFTGAVIVSVNAGYFVAGYEPTKLGEHGVLGMIGLDGVFRVRRTGVSVNSDDRGNYASVLESERSGDANVAAIVNDWDGVLRYTSMRELFYFPVAVIVGVSKDEQLAKVNQRKFEYLWWTCVVSALAILVSAIVARTLQLVRNRRRETDAAVARAKKVEYLAYHDGLTGLPNRGLFSKLLTQSISNAQRNNRALAVLFLDLDRFKSINDTLGHDAGDELLREVARRLKACLRENDIVARLGGDEFVVLLPDLIDERYTAAVARKILGATAKPFVLRGNEFSVTTSIGISTYPHDGMDEQTLTKNADIAMYHAKEHGKDNFQFFSDALNADALQRLTLENSLRHALQRQEFHLHYQAKRDTASGAISGMEALLRWQHPDLGTLVPMQFIPLAEETGLIIPIGKWVLRTACRQNMAWQREGLPSLPISVNLSTRQFFDDYLIAVIRNVLASSGMAPHLLELEITEGLLMHDVDRALLVLTALKEMGVRIAIDDFGAGYSSLATLGRFPIDTVKIDRSFIHDLCQAAGSDNLTAAVIALGKSLSLNVVAQGVETSEQADYLRAHACNEFQGFYFDKPVPADEFATWWQTQIKASDIG